MKKIYLMLIGLVAAMLLPIQAQQLPNAGFEDWSGAEFDGNKQPKTWNYSNVTQFGFKFNFAHQEAGRTGGYCAMVQDQEVGAAGITETSPGYISLGVPWVYIKSLTTVNQATAGDKGSIAWTYRPDTMQVWIKRTGDKVLDEDFHLLFYSWKGTAKGTKYQGKNENCTTVDEAYIDEESDVRQALDANRCGTDVKATQIAEGWWRERKEYGNWTCINVPIYYFTDDVPEKCNVIFSASNYPNFRANSGLFPGNSLYVDDVKMIYSSQIQSLYVGGKKWNGFVPTSTEEQEYSLGESATSIPEIYAMRGQGQLTNSKGQTATFPGRKLTDSECKITYGTIDGAPTTIEVKAEDGSSTTVYKIKFVRAASTNSRLGGIQVNGVDIPDFNAYKFDYNYELPYGTTETPVVTVTQAEDAQTVSITQANSTVGAAQIRVVAADKKTTSSYLIRFSVAKLTDNTLKDITIDGESLKGFLPTKNNYTVELPLGTTQVPEIKAVSAYKAGEQTIEYNNQGLEKVFEIKVSAPGNATTRTYKLSFKISASSYVYLEDLQVAGYDIKFEQAKKIYYISLPIGTTDIPEVTYVAGDKYQNIVKVTEVDTDNPDRTWVKVTVTAGNGDQLIYKIAFDLMRSDVTTLSGIALNGTALSGFAPETYRYDVELPIGTTALPTVTYTKGDDFQTVAVDNSAIDPTDHTATTRLTVTADNGDQAVYVINYTVAQADNTTLLMLFVNGVAIEGFDPNVREYAYVLPLGTKTWPTVTWTVHDEWQTVATRQGTFNAKKANVLKVNVTSGANTAGTYEITFTVAEASKNTDLKSIAVNGTNIEGFSASTYAYNYALPMGTTEIPTVSAEKAEDAQTLTITQAKSVTGTATIKVVAEDKSSYKNYTVTFSLETSSNVALNGISVGGELLAGFDPETLEYSISLPAGTKTLPDITCETDGYQTVSIRNELVNLVGDYKLVVTAPSGATRTYVLHFTVVTSSNADLNMIYSGGVAIADFSKDNLAYVIALPLGTTEAPALTYDKAEEGQVVNVSEGGLDGTTEIIVRAADGVTTKTYYITYTIEKANNTTLTAIKVGGVLLEGFDPETLNYAYQLSSKTTELPAVTYEAHDAYQTIVAQTDYMSGLEGEYRLIVRAQTGDTRTYIITFSIVISNNSQLNGIALDGVALEGFAPTKKDYTISLPIGTTELPEITYTAGDDAQTITVNKGDVNGRTTIVVKAEDGTSSTYTLTFSVEKANNTTLTAIKVGGVLLEGFDPETLNYSYQLSSKTTELPAVTYEAHDAYQTIVAQTDYMSGLEGEYRLIVRAQTGDTRTYIITFSIVISNNSQLNGIALDGVALEGFAPTKKDYTISLPIGTTQLPEITYTAGDDAQTITVNKGDVNGRTTIVVKAEDGTSSTYTLTFSVEKANNTTLTAIKVGGVLLEGFDPETLNYAYQLTSKTTELPAVTYEAHDAYQTIVAQTDYMSGLEGEYRLIVRAQTGDTRTYIITFSIVISNNSQLRDIALDGVALEGFAPTKKDYTISLPIGTTELPEITYTAGDDAQTITVNKGDVNGRTTIVVKAEDGTSTTYTLTFSVEKADNTTLTAIKVGGVLLEGFDPETLNYAYQLTSKTTELPAVTYEAHDAYQTIVAQTDYMSGLEGEYRLIVRAQTGDTRTYIITFSIVISSNSQLRDIALDGVTLEGFAANKKDYTIALPIGTTQLPEITYTAGDDAQTITVNKGDVNGRTTILVKAENGTSSTYTLTFYVEKANITILDAIKLNGVLLEGFDPEISEYTIDLLPTATALPTITYEQHDAYQTVTVRTDEMDGLTGNYKLVVRAQTGDTRIYTLAFSIRISDNAALEAIYLNDQLIENYNQSQLDYVITLPLGTTQAPAITYTAGDEFQQITERYRGLTGRNEIIVVAQDGTKRTYSVSFVVEKSNIDVLSMITVDGRNLADFDSEKSDYTVKLSAVEDHGRTTVPAIGFVKGDNAQQVSVVYGSINGESKVVVIAENGVNTRTYNVRFELPVSDNCALSNISLSAGSWTGFSADKTEYNIELPNGATELPEINATAGDAWQQVIINRASLEEPTTILVVAENGAQKLYTLNFTVKQFTDSQLDMITVNGKNLPDFASYNFNYVYTIPEGISTSPEITVQKKHESQQVTIIKPTLAGNVSIISTAENGAQSTYKIQIIADDSRSTNCQLQSLLVDGVEVADFDPAKLTYKYVLPAGTTELPEITWVKMEEPQKVAITAGTVKDTTYIRVLAENEKSINIYKIAFSVSAFSSANLKQLNVDGENILVPGVYEYTYNLPKTATACPTIEPVKMHESQTMAMSTPILTGDAKIKVLSATGEAAVYTIHCVSTLSDDVRLQAILVGGIPVDGFDSEITDYDIELPSGTTTLPEIKYFTLNETQQVEKFENGIDGTTTLRVIAESGASQQYTLNFSVARAEDAALSKIYLDGVELAGFSSTKYAYSYTLAPGTQSAPIVTATASAPEQTLIIVQPELTGKAQILVRSEDGYNEQTYTVNFHFDQLTDATLKAIKLNGELLDDFASDKFDYALTRSTDQVAGGCEIKYEVRDSMQTVIVENNGVKGAKLFVTAEDGSTNTYSITYTITSSSNAQLNGLRFYDAENERYIEFGEFDGATYEYTYALPRLSTAVPAIYPVKAYDAQRVTINYGAVNAQTTITVEAEDGETTATYTINFPVTKSSNTKLKELKIDGEQKDVEQTEFEIALRPEQENASAAELIVFEAEPEQGIEYTSAPLGKPSKIKITAENGEERTYTINFVIAEPEGENILKAIAYTYQTADGESHDGSIDNPTIGNNIVNLPYGSKMFTLTGVTKNCENDWQTVSLLNAGIRRTSTILVASNKAGLGDVTYTVTPVMPEFDTTGKLSDLQFNGTTIANFQPYIYSYMVGVVEQPTAENFTCVAYGGKTVTPSEIDATKKQITFTVEDGQTYSVCWFYINDGKYQKNGQYYDYLDFSQEWEATPKVTMYYQTWTDDNPSANGTMSTGFKPHGWTVPADKVAGLEYNIHLKVGILFDRDIVDLFWYTGKEVIAAGSNGALLSTINGASTNGSLPGMMTLGGTMAISPNKSGGTTSSITYSAANFINMRNTPDSLSMRYKSISGSNIDEWYYELVTVAGNTRTDKFTGDYNNTQSWRYASKAISAYSSAMTKYALTINSAPTASATDYAGTEPVRTSDLQIENVHFVYNSDITAAFVDGLPTTKEGNTFTIDVDPSYVGVPVLTFTQRVHDQTQTIEWLNNSEWVNGKLTAKVTNYGENMTDNTVYYVVLQREAITSLEVTPTGTWDQVDETHFVSVLPNGTKRLPDFTVTPNSIHQDVSISRKDWTYTVTVTNENGETATYEYTYVESKTNSTEINIVMDGITFDPAQTEYTITANAWAGALEFSKASDGQKVTYVSTNSQRTLNVIAEDGTTTQTYTITRNEPEKASSGRLANVWVNTTALIVAAEMSTDVEVKRGVAFAREESSEAVEQIFTADSIFWNVTANAGEVNSYKLGFDRQLSSDATLKEIVIDSTLIAGFNSALTDYNYPSRKNNFVLEAAPSNSAATMQITYGDHIAKIVVTAEDGHTTSTYTVTFKRQLSTDATLSMIYINDEPLPNFTPYVLTYDTVWHVDMPKTTAPAVPNITFVGGADAQTYTVDNLGFDGGVEIKVKAESGTLMTYQLNLRTEQMTDATLKALYVNGESILQAGHTEYSVVLPTDDEPNLEWFTFSPEPYQIVDFTQHTALDEPDILTVTAESGAEKTYFVNYTVDPSFYSAQLKGIVLDGDTMTDFRSDIYDYIKQIDKTKSSIPTIEAILANNGQTVTITPAGINERTTIEVIAANGDESTKKTYTFLFQEQASSDASLQGISVDYQPITPFSKDQFDYTVETDNSQFTVQAMLSNLTQKVMQVRDGNVTKLIVIAEDGTTQTYNVQVNVTVSTDNNAYLNAIKLNDETIDGFRKDSMFYDIELPESTTQWPDITVLAAAEGQRITMNIDAAQNSVIINVLAKDNATSRRYGVRFNTKTSDADTLQMIYLNGEPLENFDPRTQDYAIDLDTRAFPFVSFLKAKAAQTVIVDTLSNNSYRQRLALRVKSESGAAQRTYNLDMAIRKSAADTLRMIFLDGQPLANFNGQQENYDVVMPLGTTSYPEITYIEGDDYQTVNVEMLSATAGTATYALRVTAENGNVRVYTLNLTIAKSTLTDLRNILVNGETLIQRGKGYTADNIFSADVHEYNLVWNIGTVDIPQITYVAGDEYQRVELAHMMSSLNDSVVLRVVAENGAETKYIVHSELKHSTIDTLRNIYVNGLPIENFDAQQETFVIDLPVGTRTFPTYEAVRGDQWQTITTNPVSITTYRAEYAITVLAEAGNKRIYTLIFNVTKSADNALESIRINGEPIAANGIGYKADHDFDAAQTTYQLNWAVGTTTLPTIDFVAGDYQTLTVTHQMTTLDDSVIVEVAAESGEVRTYKVHNTLLHSTVDTLRNIYVNGLPIENFDAQQETFVIDLPVGTRTFPTYEAVRGDQWQTITTRAMSQNVYEAWYEITVLAEAGNSRQYKLCFRIAKSDLTTLRAIRVNGLNIAVEGVGYTADADYAPTINEYHLAWEVGTTELPQISYVAGDAYQTVEFLNNFRTVNDSVRIRVTAENGDVNTYTVYSNVLHSSVDTLAMIYVNNLPLENFDAYQEEFEISLPVGTRTFPTVEAVKGFRLQTLSQSVLTSTDYERVIRYTVVAEDGKTTRNYTLNFRVEKSDEQLLNALLVNGELISAQGKGYVADYDFDPERFVYNLLWEVGTTAAPVFTYEAADTLQTVNVIHAAYSVSDSLVLRVQAESGAVRFYTVHNTLYHSANDQLAMIYTDNVPVPNFSGEQTAYDIALPVGRRVFPTIDYDLGDEYQQVFVDTLSKTTYEATYRIRVQAEDGVHGRIYTVHFDVAKSAKDNLEAIYLNGKLLSGFAPDVYEYEYTLLADDTVPEITFDAADKFQTISIIEGTPDGTAYINVTAENGNTQRYTIHFPIQRSSNAYLEGITINGKPLEDFDKEQFTYRVTLPYGTTSMPIVNYMLAIPAVQRGAIEYDQDNWKATITVAAENGNINTYELTFNVAKSDNALLEMITLDGVAIPNFRADSFEYEFTMPVGTQYLPFVAYEKGDEQQVITIDNPTQWSVLITVTSGNGDNTNEYLLTFWVAQNTETRLSDLQVFGQTIAGFHPDTLNYTLVYPAGTDSTELATPDDITATPMDSLATVSVLQVTDALITVTITAENGEIQVYSITQRISLPNNALLKALFVDSTLIRDFDPEVFEYTYLLPGGAVLPSVEAIAQDSLAEVSVTAGIIDSIPTLVYCVAQDGTERVYEVNFVTAPYNDGDTPTKNDVLFRYIAGTHSFLAATTRKNVQFALYDHAGHLLLFNDVPTCDPNAATVETDIDGVERLVSVDDPTEGLVVEVNPGELYFYVFFEMSKNKLSWGKVILAR